MSGAGRSRRRLCTGLTQHFASGYASRSHTLRSMPLCVLPPAEGTPGQVLLTDQGGIVLFCADSCAQFRLCLQSVRRREQSTSPPEIARPPACALFGVDGDVRLARPAIVSAPHAPPLPGADAVQPPSTVVPLGEEV